jgi:hypothetical protein
MTRTIGDLPLGTNGRSANPFLPSNEFIPDGEPRVFGDRVYLYGSHDLAGTPKRICGGDYVCYSAALDDLARWRYEGVIYRRLQDPYIRGRENKRDRLGLGSVLFAPDVIEIDGSYYLYYGVGMSRSGFGVAVASAPTGPFDYIGRVRYPDSEKPEGWQDDEDGIDDGDWAFGKGVGIFHRGRPALTQYPYDPALLLHDGRLFLYFGLLNCSVVELDLADKRTVVRNPSTGEHVTPIFRSNFARLARALTSGRKRKTVFMNAPSIRQLDGRFLLSYWAAGGGGFNGMYHAVADNPLGPFEPMGPLVALGNAWKNDPPAPTDRGGNIHGGMFEANGTWFQIYHRHTADGRQACASPLTRAARGGFEQAEYTSTGFDPTDLDACQIWPAHIACHLVGPKYRRRRRPSIVLREDTRGTEDESGSHTLQVISNTHRGASIGYKYVDFGQTPANRTVLIEVDAKNGGRIHVYLDAPHTGQLIATLLVSADSGGRGWQTVEAPVEPVVGRHALFFVFESDKGTLGDVARFGFQTRGAH